MALTLATACDDFLTKIPEAKLDAETFFSDEKSLELYANGFVESMTPSAETLYRGDVTTDLIATRNSSTFLTTEWTSSSQTGWSYGNWHDLFDVNYFLQHMHEAELSEICCDYAFRAFLIFVGCHGKFHLCGGKPSEQLHDSRIRSGEVAFVPVVIGDEQVRHLLHHSIIPPVFRKGGPEEVVDTSSDHPVVFLKFPFRASASCQCVVACRGKVLYGVEKSTVKVKYGKSCHSE